jgi:hypothetical protein
MDDATAAPVEPTSYFNPDQDLKTIYYTVMEKHLKDEREQEAQYEAQQEKQALEKRKTFHQRIVTDFGWRFFQIVQSSVDTYEDIPGEDDPFAALALKFTFEGYVFYLVPGSIRDHSYFLYYQAAGQGRRRDVYAEADFLANIESFMVSLREAMTDIQTLEKRQTSVVVKSDVPEPVSQGPWACFSTSNPTEAKNILNRLQTTGYKATNILMDPSAEAGYNGSIVIVAKKKFLGLF